MRLLARDEAVWTAETIEEAIAAGTTRRLRLRRPVPIHLVYQTAWVAAGGSLEFRDDLYRRDRAAPAPARPIPCEEPRRG